MLQLESLIEARSAEYEQMEAKNKTEQMSLQQLERQLEMCRDEFHDLQQRRVEEEGELEIMKTVLLTQISELKLEVKRHKDQAHTSAKQAANNLESSIATLSLEFEALQHEVSSLHQQVSTAESRLKELGVHNEEYEDSVEAMILQVFVSTLQAPFMAHRRMGC